MQKGLFISLEGPDGSGKTTVTSLLYQRLLEKGIACIHTREPGGIEIAEKIRQIILDPENTQMDARTEALLYAASRRQHLIQKVLPALNAGQIVLCERFIDSSLAYQGYGRQIGFDAVYELNLFAIENHFPDLTIYLDVSEEVGLKRIESRLEKDRLDMESLAFHHLVNEGYAEVLRRFKDRIKIVDASKPLDEVVENCLTIIEKAIHG